VGFPRLRGLGVTSAAASAIAGTAIWTLFFALLSKAGMGAPRIALAGSALHLVMALAVWRRRSWSVLHPRGPAAAWVAFAAITGAAAAIALLPLARREGFLIGNDTFTYCALADWLQGHGFGTPAETAPDAIIEAIPRQWQAWSVPLGASYVLALVGAAVRAPTSLLVYPATSALGIVLSVCGIWVAGRWTLSLRGVSLAFGSLVYAVLPHASYWAHHNGFLSQTLAVPSLLLGLGAVARVGRTREAGLAALIALPAAYLGVVYLPFLPLLAASGFVQVLLRARGGSREEWLLRLWFVVRTLLLFAALVGFDLWSVGRGLTVLGRVTVGMNVPLVPRELLVFILGTRAYVGGNVFIDGWPTLPPFHAGVLLLLALLGTAVAGRRPAWPLLTALALLAGLVAFYSLFVADPWTGRRGHSWNVFKAVQWAFPLVVLLVATGADWLRRKVLSHWPVTFSAVVTLSVLPVHWTWGAFLGEAMTGLIGSEHPLAEVAGVKSSFRDLPGGELVLLGRPASNSPWLAAYTALFAYPRRVLGDWEDSASIAVDRQKAAEQYRSHLARLPDAGSIVLTAGFVPRAEPVREPLGGGFSRLLILDRPLLVQLVDPTRGLEIGPRFGIGPERTKLVFFSPTASVGALDIEYRLCTEGAPVPLVVQQTGPAVGGQAFRTAIHSASGYEVRLDGAGVSRLPIRLERGLNTVVLTASLGGSGGDGVGRLLEVEALSLTPLPRGQPAPSPHPPAAPRGPAPRRVSPGEEP
jgi:hypothetical protein